MKPHMARYTSPAVYYTYAFSLPPKTDIYKLADRLLKSDLATAALPAGAENVRFAHRFQETFQNRALAESLGQLIDVEEGRTKFLSWVRRNPKAALFLLRRNMLRLRRGRAESTKEPDQTLLDALKELTEAADDLRGRLANAGLIMGVAAGVDGALLSPRYLNLEPFIRLELNTLYVESDSFSATELVVFLVLHRSGVALLTIVAIPGERSTDELLHASAARNVVLQRTALPARLDAAVIDLSGCEIKKSEWTQDPDSSARVNDITWDEPLPLNVIFEAYAHLTCLAAGGDGDYRDWICYATLFIDGLLCCDTRKRWLQQHAPELAGLIARDPSYALIKSTRVSETLEREHGRRINTSAYFNIGNALSLDWTFGSDIAQSSPVHHFHTTAIIENVLLQYWKLYSLELLLSADTWTMSNVVSVQRQLITGLEEYRSTKLIAEEARWIEREIGEKLELDRIYQHIMDRIGSIQHIVVTRAAEVSARRNIVVAGIAALAAVVLGVPAIRDILAVVAQVDTRTFPGILAEPLQSLARSGATGIWTAYIALVLIAIAAIVLGFAKRARDKNKRLIGKFGIPWNEVRYLLEHPEYREGRAVLNPGTDVVKE
jgi:hypothetical protein